MQRLIDPFRKRQYLKILILLGLENGTAYNFDVLLFAKRFGRHMLVLMDLWQLSFLYVVADLVAYLSCTVRLIGFER